MKPLFSSLNRAVLALSLLLLGGCSSDPQYSSAAPTVFPVLTATGMAPLSLQPGETEQEKMRQAMRVAILDGYRELAQQVHGVRLTGMSDVDQQQLRSDSFKSSVTGLIRGAKVVRTYPLGDTYVAELELDYEKVWQLYLQQPRSQAPQISSGSSQRTSYY
ncbi:MAG: LPP20 family lipoprotein [Ferrimonas sp.]